MVKLLHNNYKATQIAIFVRKPSALTTILPLSFSVIFASPLILALICVRCYSYQPLDGKKVYPPIDFVFQIKPNNQTMASHIHGLNTYPVPVMNPEAPWPGDPKPVNEAPKPWNPGESYKGGVLFNNFVQQQELPTGLLKLKPLLKDLKSTVSFFYLQDYQNNMEMF